MFKNRVVHFDFPIDQKICPTLYDICTTRPADIKRRVARPVPVRPGRRYGLDRAGGRPVIVFAFET